MLFPQKSTFGTISKQLPSQTLIARYSFKLYTLTSQKDWTKILKASFLMTSQDPNFLWAPQKMMSPEIREKLRKQYTILSSFKGVDYFG